MVIILRNDEYVYVKLVTLLQHQFQMVLHRELQWYWDYTKMQKRVNKNDTRHDWWIISKIICSKHTKLIEQKFQVVDLVTAQRARPLAQMTTIQGYNHEHEN
jgi:hypothetical protein